MLINFVIALLINLTRCIVNLDLQKKGYSWILFITPSIPQELLADSWKESYKSSAKVGYSTHKIDGVSQFSVK